jgi:hypothetical protein
MELKAKRLVRRIRYALCAMRYSNGSKGKTILGQNYLILFYTDDCCHTKRLKSKSQNNYGQNY